MRTIFHRLGVTEQVREAYGDNWAGWGDEGSSAIDHPANPDRASPLRALYHRWRAIKTECHALTGECDDEVAGLVEQMLEIEQQAADFVPRTLEDALFKIVFADDHGDMNLTVFQRALVRQAYAITGVAGWTAEDEATYLAWCEGRRWSPTAEVA